MSDSTNVDVAQVFELDGAEKSSPEFSQRKHRNLVIALGLWVLRDNSVDGLGHLRGKPDLAALPTNEGRYIFNS